MSMNSDLNASISGTSVPPGHGSVTSKGPDASKISQQNVDSRTTEAFHGIDFSQDETVSMNGKGEEGRVFMPLPSNSLILSVEQVAAKSGVFPPPEAQLLLTEAQKAAKIAEIEKVASEATTNLETSSQKILNEMIKTFEELGYTDIQLNSILDQEGENGSYKVKPYLLNSDPPQTCYQIDVIYSVQAKDDKGVQKEISFKRTISTRATNPKDATLLALHFKKIVGECATFGTKLEDKSVKRDPKFKEHALASKQFSFSFQTNRAGAMTRLSAIYVMDDKTKATLEHKIAHDTKTYGYNFKNKESEPQHVSQAPGHYFFESEEQRLIQQHGVIVQNRS